MSEENVAVMRRLNALVNAGRMGDLEQLMDPGVELRDLNHAPDLPEVVRGLDGVVELLARWTDVYDGFRAEVLEYVDLDPWVVCDTRWYGRARDGAIAVDLRGADAYELAEGRVVRGVIGCADVPAARRAIAGGRV